MPDIEFSTPNEIQAYQDSRLREAISYLAAHSPYYRRMFASHGIDPSRIQTTADLATLPTTEKKDLQLHNSDFLCVPREKIIDYVTTSGTLGDPVTFACTDADLDRLAYNEMKSFASAGVRPGDIVQLSCTLDKRFMAGMAYFLGLRRLGAGVIRVGNGLPQLQWDTIQRIKPNTIMCVPSFILRLIEYAEQQGIDYRASSVKRIIGIGEGLRNQDLTPNLLAQRILEKWDVQLYPTYSSTEMGATFAECQCHCGGHLHPELLIVEILGPDLQPLPDGQVGEITVTTLGVEGMPLLRFRTGDLAAKITEPCACGRSSLRLTPIVGRLNNMIKLKGTTLYPPAIYDVLDNAPFVHSYAVVVSHNTAGTDQVTVKLALNHQPQTSNPTPIIKELKDRFRARLRVTPDIEILTPDEIQRITLPPHTRKPIKFIDLR